MCNNCHPRFGGLRKTVKAGKLSFNKVDDDQWYFNMICWVLNRGLINGCGDDNFPPTM